MPERVEKLFQVFFTTFIIKLFAFLRKQKKKKKADDEGSSPKISLPVSGVIKIELNEQSC